MNEDKKTQFLLMMALGITILAVMHYFMPPPPPPPEVRPEPTAPRSEATPNAAQGGTPAAVAFNPQVEYLVSVRVGEAAPDGNGYEADFSTQGGSMSAYRLLGYYRQPGEIREQGDEVILLDRLARGMDSLRIDLAWSGASRPDLKNIAIGAVNYELVEAPEWADVTPPPPAAVKRGDKLVFRAVAGDWELVKTFSFPRGEGAPAFTIDLDLEWRNLADANRLLLYRLAGPAGMIPDDDSVNFGAINFVTARQPSAGSATVEVEHVTLAEVSKVAADKAKNVAAMTKTDNRASLAWIGSKNRFFVALLAADGSAVVNSNGGLRRAFVPDPAFMPEQPDIRECLKSQPVVNAGGGEVPVFGDVCLSVEPGMVASGAGHSASYRFYGGPAVDSLMERADPRFSGVIAYTFSSYFNFISRWLVELLTFFDRFLGNYGLAIIVVTLLVRGIMHPLNRKSFVSMNKMQKLAPQMKALQAKYSGDKARQQQELSKLYKDNNVSMAGGCLPVFLQLPIFFALYGAFSQGFQIRHASFIPGWIVDLSKPDSVYDFGWNSPYLPAHLSLLPILYLGLQYFQMSLQPKPSDPQQESQQRMMRIMPLMFVFIFYTMPAGLVLYFAVSALFGVAENWWMRKRLFPRLGLGDQSDTGASRAAQAGVGAAEVRSHAGKTRKKK